MSEERLRDLMRDATDGITADNELASRAWKTRRGRRRRYRLAVGAAVVSAAAIVVGLVVVLDQSDTGRDVTAPSDTVRPEEKDGRAKSRPHVTASDRLTVRRFVMFARNRDQDAGRVRFAPDVALGLGDEVVRTLHGGQVRRAQEWKIRRRGWRGWSGPFSALSTLRRNGDTELNTIVGRRGRCAMSRTQSPGRFDGLRRIAVEPRQVGSCMEWFEVAIYIDGRSRIHAVTLDLWEP